MSDVAFARITEVNNTRIHVMGQISSGQQVLISTDFMPPGLRVFPAVGEVWLIDKALGDSWRFVAKYAPQQPLYDIEALESTEKTGTITLRLTSDVTSEYLKMDGTVYSKVTYQSFWTQYESSLESVSSTTFRTPNLSGWTPDGLVYAIRS